MKTRPWCSMDDPEVAFGAALADVIVVHVAGVVQFVANRAGAKETRSGEGGGLSLLQAFLGGFPFPSAECGPIEAGGVRSFPFDDGDKRPRIGRTVANGADGYGAGEVHGDGALHVESPFGECQRRSREAGLRGRNLGSSPSQRSFGIQITSSGGFPRPLRRRFERLAVQAAMNASSLS